MLQSMGSQRIGHDWETELNLKKKLKIKLDERHRYVETEKAWLKINNALFLYKGSGVKNRTNKC